MPTLAKIPRWLQHLIFWLEVLGWYYIQYQVLGDGQYFGRRMLVVMPVDILAACVSSYLLVDQLLLKGKYIWFLLAMAASTEVFIGLERLLEFQFLLPLAEPESLALGFWDGPSIFNIGVRIYLIVSLFAGMRLFKFWLIDQNRKRDLEQQSLQTELAMLRTQIQPHFLFNTLNNIDALVHADPDKASEAIARLSEILRFQLYEKETDRISLREEINFLEATISLLELRRRDTEGIDFKVQGQTDYYYMPALLLAPFVENAYKHGDKQAPIKIHLETKVDRLYFRIENKLKASSDNNYQSMGGLGLSNVKRRFELYFEADYELTYGPEGEQFVLSLQIPLFRQALNNQ
ncbi:MAG: sensor histidine kinase [Bacteroidia bacterium]